MKPLVWKELRENVRWLPVGLVVVGVVCWIVRPDRPNPRGLIAMDLTTQLAIVTPLLAFALGVVQSYRDLQPAAGAYLNHRSVTASQVFFAKMTAGFLLYATAIAIPILGLVGWITYHGMQWHPMRPAQVVPALVFAIASFVMHPAAMLMMSRNASWWGTRLFPLFPAAAVLIPFFAVLSTEGLWGAGISLLIALPLLAWMTAIARQSWRDLATDPPADRVNPKLRRRWLLPTYLTVGLTACYLSVVAFTMDTVVSLSRSDVYVPTPRTQVAIDTTSGKPWLLTYLQIFDESTNAYVDKIIGGDRIEDGGTVDPMKPVEETERFRSLSILTPLRRSYHQSDGFFTNVSWLEASSQRYQYSYDSRGYVLCYDTYPVSRWVQTIAADGVYRAGRLTGKPFTSDPVGAAATVFASIREAGYAVPLIDSQGVYLLESSPSEVRSLVDQEIDAATVAEIANNHAPRLILQSASKLLEYQLVDASGSDSWYEAAASDNTYYSPVSKSLADLSITAKRIHTYQVPEAMAERSELWRVASASESLWASGYTQQTPLFRLTPDGSYETIQYDVASTGHGDSVEDVFRMEWVVLGLFPGFVGIAFAAVGTWISMSDQSTKSPWELLAQNPIATATTLLTFALVTLLAVGLTARVARRRGLSRGQTLAWCWSALLLGLVTPLAMIAIYRQVHREPCPACTMPRRVDTERCEHCGAPWQSPTTAGIEIMDGVLEEEELRVG